MDANNTYIITSDFIINCDKVIPNNVTLVFQGGKIITNSSNPVSLVGNHTKIVAPIA
jgi:hypothetical protein